MSRTNDSSPLPGSLSVNPILDKWVRLVPGAAGPASHAVTVSPGKGGLATYSTPLDDAGNSVRGQLVAQHLSRQLGLDLFVSTQPVWPSD